MKLIPTYKDMDKKLTEAYKRAAITELLAANLHRWDLEKISVSKDEGSDKFKEKVKESWHAANDTAKATICRNIASHLLEDLDRAGLIVTPKNRIGELELVDAMEFLLTIPARQVVVLPKPYDDA